MSDPENSSARPLPRALRWLARLGALAGVSFMVVLVLVEHRNPMQMPVGDLLLFFLSPVAVLAGLLLGWRWEFHGGLLAVAGGAAYFGASLFLGGGFPKEEWRFVACAAPGLLFLWSGLLTRLRARRAAARSGPG